MNKYFNVKNIFVLSGIFAILFAFVVVACSNKKTA